MSGKKDKQPSVSDALRTQELLIARENSEIGKDRDPLSLIPPMAEDERLVTEKERADFQQAIRNVEVRRVLYRLLRRGGMWQADSDPNAIIMAHHAGRRSLALELYEALMDADPGSIYQMEREWRSDQKSKERKPDGE